MSEENPLVRGRVNIPLEDQFFFMAGGDNRGYLEGQIVVVVNPDGSKEVKIWDEKTNMTMWLEPEDRIDILPSHT